MKERRKERKRWKGREKGESESRKARVRTKEAVCGEQGIESPSETNKNWNNNKSQKALPPLLFAQPVLMHVCLCARTHTCITTGRSLFAVKHCVTNLSKKVWK